MQKMIQKSSNFQVPSNSPEPHNLLSNRETEDTYTDSPEAKLEHSIHTEGEGKPDTQRTEGRIRIWAGTKTRDKQLSEGLA